MQQNKISIDLKLPTKWEDLSDKQLRYVFALLAQGFTATEVKAYCLHRWAGLTVLHRYGNLTSTLFVGHFCKYLNISD